MFIKAPIYRKGSTAQLSVVGLNICIRDGKTVADIVIPKTIMCKRHWTIICPDRALNYKYVILNAISKHYDKKISEIDIIFI